MVATSNGNANTVGTCVVRFMNMSGTNLDVNMGGVAIFGD